MKVDLYYDRRKTTFKDLHMKNSYWTTQVSLPTDIAKRVLSLTGGSDLHDLSYGIQVLCSRFSKTYSVEGHRDRDK